MEEIQQAKQGLLVYLQANRQYIQQKVYNEFNVECIQQKTIDTIDVQKMTKTIKQIFDFGDNKVYQYFFSHLVSNIKQYIEDQLKAKAATSYYILDVEKLTDIVKFCINHGFDYSAVKKKKQESPPKVVPEPEPELKKQVQKKDEFAYVKPRISTFLQADKIPQKREFKLQKYTMPQKNMQPRYLTTIPKQPVTIKQQPSLPLVSPLEEAYLLQHRKDIRERLLKLYNFYCIQQQSLGVRPTFDHIKGQGETMSLGGFMQFCQYTRVFYCKQMTKDILMTQFKKVAEGKINIDFALFQKLLIELDQKYLKMVGHDLVQNPMPTYQARLMLNEPNKLGELKKHRNLIFGTRNKQGREVVKFNRLSKYEEKELTLHSGRFSTDLVDLKQKVEQQQQKPKKRRSQSVNGGSVNLFQLKKMKLPKLDWIDQEEVELANKEMRIKQV